MTYPPGATFGYMLQWGRDLSIAEFPAAILRHDREGCFNGAAIYRSRNSEQLRRLWASYCGFNGAAIYRSRNSSKLITGTATDSSFNGAAIYRSRNSKAASILRAENPASMGPRSIDRGIGSPPATGSPPYALQWGRDLSIAEFTESNAAGHTIALASMGPRSIDRGIPGVPQ